MGLGDWFPQMFWVGYLFTMMGIGLHFFIRNKTSHSINHDKTE